MNEWDSRAKYEVLDDYGYRRMKVRVVQAIALQPTGWIPHFFVRIRGTDEDWRQTKVVKGVRT
jgi:hypothetical protein